jgi:hypothetical protein
MRERLGLRLHLLLCDACSQFSRQIALLRQAVRQWSARVENDARLVLSTDARRRITTAVESKTKSLTEARQNPDQNVTD